MIFNNFLFRIILNVILITITAFAFAWSIQQEFMVATSTGLLVALVIETVSLIHFLIGIKKDFQRFVEAIKNEDSTLLFGYKSRDNFLKEVHRGFNEIMTDFKLVRREKELERQFFQNTVEHVKTGLLAINEQGQIKMANQALNELFGLIQLTNIQTLSEVHKDLPDLLLTMRNGAENSLKLHSNKELKTISIKASVYKMESQTIHIFSFQDISKQINRNEIEAWQKLIQVLRHEIMNSISPIRIMSGNLLNIVKSMEKSFADEKQKENDEIKKLSEGLHTIRKRSVGLSEFVEKYRNLAKIPEPVFTKIQVSKLFRHIKELNEDNLKDKNIEIETAVNPQDIILTGDEKMLEQVLLNIIKNAIEAIDNQTTSKILIQAKEVNQEVVISVKDNGPGIPMEKLDKIFIPFYTTKEEGSGIGLSFSRQIMHLHGGSIQIHSEENTGTEVVLSF